MVMFTGMIPTVGQVYGKPVNLVLSAENQRTIVSTNVQSIGTSGTAGDPQKVDEPITWPTLEVKTIYSDGTSVVAIGNGVDSNNTNKKIAWNNKSGSWVIGQTPLESIRPVGVEDNAGYFLFAAGESQAVFQSNMAYFSTPTPVGGFVDQFHNYQVVNSTGRIDSLSNNGTTTVGASLNTIGTWVTDAAIVEGGSWSHEVGVAELVLTNNRGTSYTFPGAAGNTQIQRANAIPAGNSHPINWDIADSASQGYYGLMGTTGNNVGTGTHLTVTWTQT